MRGETKGEEQRAELTARVTWVQYLETQEIWSCKRYAYS